MTVVGVQVECHRCGVRLASGSLVCAQCHTLVHAARLEELAARARLHEQSHEAVAAHLDWQAMLELLPTDSVQAAWVRTRADDLVHAQVSAVKNKAQPAWARRLGPLAPLVLLLPKLKIFFVLLKLPFLLSFVGFAGLYWALYGIKFGIGLAALVLVHELGHFIELKRRHMAADMPMFIPGFGAYVRWIAVGVTPEARAMVSLAGPLAGTLAAALCGLLWLWTRERLWIGLTAFSAFINLMNLIPVWSLDGGQAMVAINRSGRIAIAVAAIVFAAYLSQPLLLLVAAGGVYRAFSKEPSAFAPPDRGVTAYFLVLLGALGYLSTLAPLGASLH